MDHFFGGGPLQRYEDLRRERTAKIDEGANENGDRFRNRAIYGSDEDAERYLDEEWAPQKVIGRSEWLYDYGATTVSM